MNKVKTGWKLPILPLPVCILGAHVNGKPNFNTIVWFNMLHDNPPLIGIAMAKRHYTNQGIKQNRSFSVNIPTCDMVVVTDYCGLHSGLKVDKSKEFKNTDLFIGEIVEIYSDEKYIKHNKPNVKKLDSFIFLMPNGPYWKIGDYLAEAYEVGNSYKPKN